MNAHKVLSRRLFVSLSIFSILLMLTACGGGGGGAAGETSFVVTGQAGPNGTIAPATQKIVSGKTATLTVTPASGYMIGAVTGCNGKLADNTYTTGAISSACTVKATFIGVSSVDIFSARSDGSFTVSVPNSNVVLVGMVVPSGGVVPAIKQLDASGGIVVTGIPGAIIEVRAERDTGSQQMKTLTVKIRAPGFSSFFRAFENVSGTVHINAELAESSGLKEIDIASLETSSLTRAGRSVGLKQIESDEQVTVQMLQNSKTGNKRTRILRASGGEPAAIDPAEMILVDYSFPLKGLRVAESSTKMWAEVSYLDSPNNPELMPGGFIAEPQGETEGDIMVTFGASQIELIDDAGNLLLTDPTDRTTDVTIRMLVPIESYAGLQDEEPQNESSFSVPYYYFDEALKKWVLHRNAAGIPQYSHLQDQFGNVLTPADVLLLKRTRDVSYDANGNKLIDPKTGLAMESKIENDPRYAPLGVDPKTVRIYSVNKVHHFTTWNSDAGYRTNSFNLELRDKSGRRINPPVRISKRSGGSSSDSCRPNNGLCNLHTDRNVDRQADSLIKLFLDRSITREERADFFEKLKRTEDPKNWNAFIEALRRYGENLKDEIGQDNSGGDFGRGIRAIFSNATINDAFINTDGIDCFKTPDICRSIIAAAGEEVNKSTSAQKATAFLMEIAVDAYNPGNFADVGYFVDKGIGMLDITMNMDGVATDMKGVYDNYGKVKAAAELIRAAMYFREGKWFVKPDKWEGYWSESKKMAEGLQAMQDLASKAGEKTSFFGRRTARDHSQIESLSVPEFSDEAVMVSDRALMREIENFGGLWLGANAFSHQGYQWGYFTPYAWGTPEYGQPPVFTPVAPPTDLVPTGGNVAYLEYFNGMNWAPIGSLSDTGADPLFLPIPTLTSWGNGTAVNPTIYLGMFQIDVPRDVSVSGRVLNQKNQPIKNVDVSINGDIVKTDGDGNFSGTTDSLGDYVTVSLGNWVRTFSIDKTSKKVAIGEVKVYQGISWGKTPYSVGGLSIDENERQATVTIQGTPYYGKNPVLYQYRLDRNYYYYSDLAPLAEGEIETDKPFDFTFDLNDYLQRIGEGAFTGYYYLRVSAFTSDSIDPTLPSEVRCITFYVTNNMPEIIDLTFEPKSGKLGDTINVTMKATDEDGVKDLSSLDVGIYCTGDDGQRYYLYSIPSGDENIPDTVNGSVIVQPGNRSAHWKYDTLNYSYMWTSKAQTFNCELIASVRDKGGNYAVKQEQFTLLQNQVNPEVRYKYLVDEYVVSHNINLLPSSLTQFYDRNQDIVSYEVNCGYDESGNPASGEKAVQQTSNIPIYNFDGNYNYYGKGCLYEVYSKDQQTGYYDTSKAGPMAGKEFTYTYKATDSRGESATVSAKIKVLLPLRVNLTNEDGSPLIEKIEQAQMCSSGELALSDPTVCNKLGERLFCDKNDDCLPVIQTVELPIALPSGTDTQKKIKIVALTGNQDGVVSDLYYYINYRPARNGWTQRIQPEVSPTQEGTVELKLASPGTYTINLNAAEYLKDSGTGLKTGYPRFYINYSREIRVNSTFDVEIAVDGLYLEKFHKAGSRLVTDTPAHFSAETIQQPDAANWTPKYLWRLFNYAGKAEGDAPVETQPCSTKNCDLIFDSVGQYRLDVEVYNENDPLDAAGARPTVIKYIEFKVLAKPSVTLGKQYTPRVVGEVTLGDRYTATASFTESLVQRTQWVVQFWTGTEWVNSSGHSVISSSKNSLEVVFNQEGKYRIVTIVTSVEGVTVSVPGEDIVVTQYPPEVTTLEANKLEISPGGTVEFTATGKDLDARATDRLGFEWLLDGALLRSTTSDKPVGDEKTATGSLSWTFPVSQGERDYKISVRVVDATGRRSAPSNLVVKAMFKGPTELAIVTSPSSASGTKPFKVDFTASVVKGDGNITKYEWRFAANAQVINTGTTPMWSYTYADHGEYTASVKVTDSNGKTTQSQVVVKVLDFVAPSNVIIQTTPEPAKGNIPFKVNFVAQATPGDGKITKYEWQAQDSSEWVSTQTTPNWTFTYTERGNYTARLRVTDSNGKISQVAVKAVTAIDPNAQETVEFTFKERRADGLGPVFIYPDDEGEGYQQDAKTPDFVHVPLENNQPNWLAKSVKRVETANLLFNQFGLFGMNQANWSDVNESLVMIDTVGSYDIGVSMLENYNDQNSQKSVSLEKVTGEYTCGYIAYGSYGSELYQADPLTTATIHTSMLDFGVDDTLQVLALLGTGRVDYYGTCSISYAGYVAGKNSAYVLPAAKLAMIPLEVTFPELVDTTLSMEITQVRLIDAGGRALAIAKSQLPSTALGGYLLPVLDGREVEVTVQLLKKGQYGTSIASSVISKASLVDNKFKLDLSGLEVTGSNALVLKNAPKSYFATYTERVGNMTIESSVYSSENSENLGPILKAPDASTVMFKYDQYDDLSSKEVQQSFMFNTSFEAFNAAFAGAGYPVVDLSQAPSFVQDTLPGKVTATFNEKSKTIDVSFSEAQGDACVVTFEGRYQYETSTMEYHRSVQTIVRPTLGKLEIPYSYTASVWKQGEPEMVDVVLDNLTAGLVNVECGRLVVGASYETFVREVLANYNSYDLVSEVGFLADRNVKVSQSLIMPVNLPLFLNVFSPAIVTGESVFVNVAGEMINNAAYQWFVNGEQIEGADQPTLNWQGSAAPGSYEISVVVTSPTVIGRPITTMIVVRGPDSTLYDFTLRQLRSDGMGPALPFNNQRSRAVAQEEMDPEFLDVRDNVLTTTPIQSPLFTFNSGGLFGTRTQEQYDRKVKDILYEVTTPGIYKLGVGDYEVVSLDVDLPRPNTPYNCGLVTYGSVLDQGRYDEDSDYEYFYGQDAVNVRLNIRSKNMSVTGDVLAVAMLGYYSYPDQRCQFDYSGFYQGNYAGIQFPAVSGGFSEVTPTFDPSLAENRIVPQLSFVEFTYNGMSAGFPAELMPQSAESGKLKAPVISDASYTLGYSYTSNMLVEYVDGSQSSGNNQPDVLQNIVISGLKIANLKAVNLSKIKAGNHLAIDQNEELDTLVLDLRSGYDVPVGISLKSSTVVKLKTIAAVNHPSLGDYRAPTFLYINDTAAKVVVGIEQGDGVPLFGYSRLGSYLIPPTSIEKTQVLDILNPPVTAGLSVSNLQFNLSSASSAYKVSYTASSQADLCVVIIEGIYAQSENGAAIRSIELLTDGKSKNGLLIPYGRPASRYYDYNLMGWVDDPAYEWPDSAFAMVACGDAKDESSYLDLLKRKLADYRADEIKMDPATDFNSYITTSIMLQ